MAMLVILMLVMVTVGAPLGLERGMDPREVGAKLADHVLDHLIGPNTKDLVVDFSRQMSVTEMPGQACKLIGIVMPDLDD